MVDALAARLAQLSGHVYAMRLTLAVYPSD